VTQSRHAFISIVFCTVALMLPASVWAQTDCDLDPAIVDAVDQMQRSHQEFSYSGTFLKESSGSRNFIAKSHRAGDERGQLD